MSAPSRSYLVTFLLERPPLEEELRACFPELTPAEEVAGLARFLDEGHSQRLVVDVLADPWPDQATQAELNTPPLGLGTRPGNLQRSLEQCWVWDTAAAAVEKHQAVVRIRLEIEPPEEDQPFTPQQAAAALVQVIQAALAGSSLPGMLAYFQPAGEVLLPPHVVAEMVENAKVAHIPPLDAWSNIRISWLTERWSLVETIGNIQLDLPDVELYFEHDRHDPNLLAGLARTTSLKMLQSESPPTPGTTLSSHDETTFTVHPAAANLLPPTRPIVRLLPEETSSLPPDLAERLGLG